MSLAGLLLAAPLTLSGGLRLDAPDDAAPHILGVVLDTRLFLLDDAYLGAEVTYGGGVDDRNPERVRVMGKLEVAAALGVRPEWDETYFASAGLRAGMLRVDGWPRGALPTLLGVYGPLLGAEVGLGAWLFRPWGHPMGPELRLSYTRLRIDGAWVDSPAGAVFLTGRLFGPAEK